jgi:hypothetical protein
MAKLNISVWRGMKASNPVNKEMLCASIVMEYRKRKKE